MKLFQQFFNFYLDASIHVALASLSLLYGSSLLLNIPFDRSLAIFIFFSTILTYNFMKYGVETKKYTKATNKNAVFIKALSIFSLLIVLLQLPLFHRNTLIFLVFLALLTGLYAIPLLPNSKNLRSLGGLKIVIVAIVWAGTTVIFPVLHQAIPMSWDIWIETVQRFILILILIIPFEIRDLAYDAPELKTIPQRFGVANSKIIASFGVVLFYPLTFLKDTFLWIDLIGKGLLFLMMGFTIFSTKRNQSPYFASFWVEAIPIFWVLILWGMLSFY